MAPAAHEPAAAGSSGDQAPSSTAPLPAEVAAAVAAQPDLPAEQSEQAGLKAPEKKVFALFDKEARLAQASAAAAVSSAGNRARSACQSDELTAACAVREREQAQAGKGRGDRSRGELP
jgi:hypothetical protein